MKKSYLMLAAAAALFAACSNDDSVAEAQNAEQQVAAGEVPVGFDVYVNRATTRGGTTGDVTIDALKTGAMKTVGFGVFAYHTNTNTYDQTFVPNFMYNQQVLYKQTEGPWEYTPVKYWPNEFGSGALSDEVDKVSFFAYAPYVEVTPASGKVADDKDWGIVGMKSNSATGDPMVKYMASFYTDKQVDLVWGTAGNPTDVTWNKKNEGTQTITLGKPWLDVEHPSATTGTNQEVKFQFLHSLAKVNVTVDTKVEGIALDDPDGNTKVFIRSVTFEGFEMKGALNLNNATASTPLWYNFDCANELNNGGEVTIKDGRTDGKEGVSEASREFVALNPAFIQNAVWASLAASVTGVKGEEANLFCKSDKSAAAAKTDAIYVIPNGDPLKVTIEYDVLTADINLVGKLNDGTTPGSVVKNVITRYITVGASAGGSAAKPGTFGESDGNGIQLAPGKSYTIKLHLGLNSVEFNADVTAWDPITGGADLPHNVAP